MELSEYLPLINESIKLYINKRGFITTDEIHHANIFKFAIVHYWDRFSKCVEQDFLWSVMKNISTAERLEFYLNGKPHNAPAAFYYIMRKERERNIILNLKNRRTILPNSVAFIVAAIVVCILAVSGRKILRLNLTGLYNALAIRPTQFVNNKTSALHLL